MVCNLLYHFRKNTSEVDLQFIILVSLPFYKLVVLLRFICNEGKCLWEALTNIA